MRFATLILILAAAGPIFAENTGYVNLRTDLLRVSGEEVKKARSGTLKYNDSARVMTVYINILNDTRAEARLRTSSEASETGISFLASAAVKKPGKLVQADINVYFRVPEGGIFRAAKEPGFNDAIGFSIKRMLRVTVPQAAGLYRLPEGKSIVPLLTAYSQYPLPGIMDRASEAELRLISADSSDLRRIADFPLEEPLIRDYVLDKIANFPGAFRHSMKIRSKKSVFHQKKTETQQGDTPEIKIQLIEFSKGIWRLTVSETHFIRSGSAAMPETFFYEGYLSAQRGKWLMPIRIVSSYAGKRSFYENDPGKTTREKLLMIRFR